MCCLSLSSLLVTGLRYHGSPPLPSLPGSGRLPGHDRRGCDHGGLQATLPQQVAMVALLVLGVVVPLLLLLLLVPLLLVVPPPPPPPPPLLLLLLLLPVLVLVLVGGLCAHGGEYKSEDI